MGTEAVSDSGPIIHLSEINSRQSFNIFSRLIISPEVEREITQHKVNIPKKTKVLSLQSKWKDYVEIFMNNYELHIGESESISLALQEKIKIFLTDDLEARVAAQSHGLKVHGSIGILLRAFREKIIDKKKTINHLKNLRDNSSLFVTASLIKKAIDEVNKFN